MAGLIRKERLKRQGPAKQNLPPLARPLGPPIYLDDCPLIGLRWQDIQVEKAWLGVQNRLEARRVEVRLALGSVKGN